MRCIERGTKDVELRHKGIQRLRYSKPKQKGDRTRRDERSSRKTGKSLFGLIIGMINLIYCYAIDANIALRVVNALTY
jgi:hypothetical protein